MRRRWRKGTKLGILNGAKRAPLLCQALLYVIYYLILTRGVHNYFHFISGEAAKWCS